jgi:plastocyanin
MPTTVRRAALLVLPLAALAACGGGGSEASGTADHVVELVGNDFVPAEITVEAGDTVEWVWTQQAAHNVVASDGAFESPVQPRGTWSHTFDETGEIHYVCTLHPGMEGTVTVE